jgi:hypothetical protein
MDRYFGSDALNTDQEPSAAEIRAAMGQVRLIATLFDMSEMVPAPNLATTGYALHGKSGILVLAPDKDRFNVDLRDIPGLVRLQWFDTVTGEVREGGASTAEKPWSSSRQCLVVQFYMLVRPPYPESHSATFSNKRSLYGKRA